MVLIVSCKSKTEKGKNVSKTSVAQYTQTLTPSFKNILDSADVEGSILILDPQKKEYFSNDFNWAEIGRLPASTFKITNSIISLETGIVNFDTTIFKWNGEKRYLKIWEQDLNLQQAFQFSCVPCFQEIARDIGPKNMNKFLKNLDYGNMVVDSNNIHKFWLEGDSKISQFQQIDFIKRLHYSELPITKNTEAKIIEIMLLSQKAEYTLRGKTGWAIRNGNNNGWFVGNVEIGESIYFFATNINPKEKFDMKLFSMIRKTITLEAFRSLGLIQ